MSGAVGAAGRALIGGSIASATLRAASGDLHFRDLPVSGDAFFDRLRTRVTMLLERILDNCALRELAVRGDERGRLIAIEGGRDVPFDIKRVYYIFGTQPGVARGFHAHRSLVQWLVCLNGSCRIVLDDGRSRREAVLDRPDVALEIGPMIWREMYDFADDAVLMVLASQLYDERDYIRDHDAFLRAVEEAG